MSAELAKEMPLERHALHGPTMGSRWTATFDAPAGIDLSGLQADLQAVVDRVDDQMSTWKPQSDLNRLNAAPVGAWIELPDEILHVLEAALDIGRASGGAFNIGVGELVKAWGFGFGAREAEDGAIAQARQRPLLDPPLNLRLDMPARRAMKLAPLRLDLSGIAKGFGVDELAGVMNRRGLASFLVGIDGEMRARGVRRDGYAWTVALERPDARARDAMGILELADAAVATSGDYRHFKIRNGRRASHTMNARTGAPVDNDLASVTVLADRCMMADAWATAIMASGAQAGLKLAEDFGLPVILIDRDGKLLSTV